MTFEDLFETQRQQGEEWLALRDRVFNELDTQTDRGAAIIGASIVEYSLKNLIKHEFAHRISATTERRIFEANGPLATFSGKIDIAYAFGLGYIDERKFHDLHRIRKIRNEFAHTLDPVTFKSQRIAGLCADLQFVDSLLGNSYPLHGYGCKNHQGTSRKISSNRFGH